LNRKEDILNYTTYEEAVNFVKSTSDKIKVVVFLIKDCPTCDDFIPDVFDVEIKNRSEHFDVVYVDLESSSMMFPPLNTPTAYFYIPNTEYPMPIFRVGGTLPSILQNDLNAMVLVKNNEKTFEEAFFSNTVSEVTSWMQRQIRP
jgi:thiol-disulfide isomerase/thioredoxin